MSAPPTTAQRRRKLPEDYKHSPEVRAKMAKTRTGRHHSPEHCAAISAALRGTGKTQPNVYERACACGITFSSRAHNAKFCSRQCCRAAFGHGLRHAPQFAAFARECAICKAADDLVGDHDHATGKPRGLLCRNCNLAIGNMRDDPARLRAAAAYLESTCSSI